MKKMIFFPLIMVVFLAITSTVFAESDYGKVTDITEKAGDSLSSGKGTIQTNGNTTTIRYSSATFKMLDADNTSSDGERPGPAAWIGFEVAKPVSDNDGSYKVTTPDKKTTQLKKYPYVDYVGITPDNLKKNVLNGTLLTYKYSFDWDEDNNIDQYVIIEIDPKGITLVSKDGKDTLWSPSIAQKLLDEQNPATSDINLHLFLGLIVIGGIGLGYYLKKA